MMNRYKIFIAPAALIVFVLLNPPMIRSSSIADSYLFSIRILAVLILFMVVGYLTYRIARDEKKVFSLSVSETVFLIGVIFGSCLLLLLIPLEYSYQNDVPYYEFAAQSAFMSGFNSGSPFTVYGPHSVVFGVGIDIVDTVVRDVFLSAKLTAMLFFSCSIFLIYILVRSLSGKLIAMIGVLLAVGNYEFFRSGLLASQEMMGVAFMVLFMLSFFLYMKGTRIAGYLMLFTIPLLIQARPSNAVFLLPAGIMILKRKKILPFLADHWKPGIGASLLLLPFISFMLFSKNSILVAMDSYNGGFAQHIGWFWWDGVFSSSYFLSVFPVTLRQLFLPNTAMGAVSFISLLLLVFLWHSRWKGWIVCSWLGLQATVLSSHFMSMQSSGLDPRYVPHVSVLLIVLSCLLLGTSMKIIPELKKGLTMFVIIIALFTLFFQFPMFHKEIISSGSDPEWGIMEEIKQVVPKGCSISAAERFARSFVFFLNGYVFVDSAANGISSGCLYHLCHVEGEFLISENACEQYTFDGPW